MTGGDQPLPKSVRVVRLFLLMATSPPPMISRTRLGPVKPSPESIRGTIDLGRSSLSSVASWAVPALHKRNLAVTKPSATACNTPFVGGTAKIRPRPCCKRPSSSHRLRSASGGPRCRRSPAYPAAGAPSLPAPLHHQLPVLGGLPLLRPPVGKRTYFAIP